MLEILKCLHVYLGECAYIPTLSVLPGVQQQ